MSIDIHCHVIGGGLDIENVENDVFFNMEDNQHLITWAVSHMVSNGLSQLGGKVSNNRIATDDYFELLVRLLCDSEHIDTLVLLALDAVYDTEKEKIDKVATDLYISNSFLIRTVRVLNDKLSSSENPRISKKRFLVGASINPNMPKSLDRLKETASFPEVVLLKWIPSAQHIDINNVSGRFFEALKETKLPLLCHVGPEYSFPEGIRRKELDDVEYLEKPLGFGIRVIAAHCAAPVFPVIDKDQMRKLAAMMKDHNQKGEVKLWADISALSLSTRFSYIPEMLELFNPEWLVHGSDFPIPIEGGPHLPVVTNDITPAEYKEICETRNPFDRDLKIKRAHGFAESIFGNAEKALRMP